jgi:protein-disulfide isomerase
MLFRGVLAAAVIGLASLAFGQNSTESTTVAEVNGERISAQELMQAGGDSLANLESQTFRLKEQKLEQVIGDHLFAAEAARRKISADALTEQEVTSKIAAVTPDEIHNVYELNKAKLQKPEPEMTEFIRNYLGDQRIAARRAEFIRELRAKAKVTSYLTPPPPLRLAVVAKGPSRGPADAPITIIEFEDFQCPFCKKAQSIFEEVRLRYQDKVKFVHRDFPLDELHPTTSRTHEAARCAEQQQKFWPYRDVLYKNAPTASVDQLTAYAREVGADVTAFAQCLKEERFKSEVAQDRVEGDRLGISGTPAFFINGRLLSGAQPESEFVRVIEEELRISGSKPASSSGSGK